MINVLAVDDDLDFHVILKSKLPATEFNLTLAVSETEFFEKFISAKYDICLLDLSIDDTPLKGLEIITKLRQDYESDVPIIVLSRTGSEKVVSSSLEIGANDFITKPVDGRLLTTKMKTVVSGDQAFGEVIKFGKFPGKQPDVTITARLKLKAITELGVLLEGNAFIAKGSKVEIRSPRVKEIFGVDSLEVFSSGFSSETSGVYLTAFEINPDNKDLVSKAKFWIKSNQK